MRFVFPQLYHFGEANIVSKESVLYEQVSRDTCYVVGKGRRKCRIISDKDGKKYVIDGTRKVPIGGEFYAPIYYVLVPKKFKNWRKEVDAYLKETTKAKGCETYVAHVFVPANGQTLSREAFMKFVAYLYKGEDLSFIGFRGKQDKGQLNIGVKKKLKQMGKLLKEYNDSQALKSLGGFRRHFIFTPRSLYLLKKIRKEIRNDLHKIFNWDGGWPSLNLEFIKEFSSESDWRLLWPLVKEVLRLGLHYEPNRIFGWGELSKIKNDYRKRDRIVLQTIKELRNEGVKTLKEMVEPINFRIMKQGLNPQLSVTYARLRQIKSKSKIQTKKH